MRLTGTEITALAGAAGRRIGARVYMVTGELTTLKLWKGPGETSSRSHRHGHFGKNRTRYTVRRTSAIPSASSKGSAPLKGPPPLNGVNGHPQIERAGADPRRFSEYDARRRRFELVRRIAHGRRSQKRRLCRERGGVNEDARACRRTAPRARARSENAPCSRRTSGGRAKTRPPCRRGSSGGTGRCRSCSRR